MLFQFYTTDFLAISEKCSKFAASTYYEPHKGRVEGDYIHIKGVCWRFGFIV